MYLPAASRKIPPCLHLGSVAFGKRGEYRIANNLCPGQILEVLSHQVTAHSSRPSF